jgi:hypothetical protein
VNPHRPAGAAQNSAAPNPGASGNISVGASHGRADLYHGRAGQTRWWNPHFLHEAIIYNVSRRGPSFSRPDSCLRMYRACDPLAGNAQVQAAFSENARRIR